jgi:hypothetical protein
VLDNLGVHHCAPVKKWLSEHGAQIEVFYLPRYSPELIPDERLNGDLKQAIETKVPSQTKDKSRQAATNHKEEIEKNPDRIKTFLKGPFVASAAEQYCFAGSMGHQRFAGDLLHTRPKNGTSLTATPYP